MHGSNQVSSDLFANEAWCEGELTLRTGSLVSFTEKIEPLHQAGTQKHTQTQPGADGRARRVLINVAWVSTRFLRLHAVTFHT